MLIVLMLKEIFLMVKSSILFFCIKIFCIYTIFSIIPFVVSANEANNYRVVKKKINILPITPVAILGLNAFLVNNNSENYLVTLHSNIKNYSWLIDTVETNKNFYLNMANVLPNIPIKLYLQETVELIVNVKRLNNSIPNKDYLIAQNNKTNLPYFIIISNDKNNELYLIKEGFIKVSLNTSKTISTAVIDNIKIKFNQEDIQHLEILTGFKQTKSQFELLKNYIKLQK